MRQGEQAESFSIITSGRVEIRHVSPDGQVVVCELASGTIVGKIALLRHAPRTATVIAKDNVSGYVGRNGAFECMLAIPDIADRMVRTARQRLAAYIEPIPVSAEDGAQLLLRPVLPGDAERFKAGGAFRIKPCTGGTRVLPRLRRDWPTCSRWIIEPDHAFLKDGLGEALARVAVGLLDLGDDVVERGVADAVRGLQRRARLVRRLASRAHQLEYFLGEP